MARGLPAISVIPHEFEGGLLRLGACRWSLSKLPWTCNFPATKSRDPISGLFPIGRDRPELLRTGQRLYNRCGVLEILL
jgi:hypothetical protein